MHDAAHRGRPRRARARAPYPRAEARRSRDAAARRRAGKEGSTYTLVQEKRARAACMRRGIRIAEQRCTDRGTGQLIPMPLEPPPQGTCMNMATKASGLSAAAVRAASDDNTTQDLQYCGATVGRRIESTFVTGGVSCWYAGTVTKLLGSWMGWVEVDFDDGETLQIDLKDSQLTWRWASSNTSRAVNSDIGTKRSRKRAATEVIATPTQAANVNYPGRMNDLGRKQRSKYAGVQPREWKLRGGKVVRKWRARISCADGISKSIGTFDDEETAAKAYDQAARTIRGSAAHGCHPQTSGFGGPGQPVAAKRLFLNFPTAEEEERLKVELETEEAGRAQRKREQAQSVERRQSSYHGVYWVCKVPTTARPWRAVVRHRRKIFNVGRYSQEEAAARAYDAVARTLRGPNAHIGDARKGWSLNFPTQAERTVASRQAASAAVRRQRAPYGTARKGSETN